MKRFILALTLLIAGCTASKTPTGPISEGQALLTSKGCIACHSINGQPGIGPTFYKLYGTQVTFVDGSTAAVDEAYLRESIVNPQAKVVRPYSPVMPVVPLSEGEVDAIVKFIVSLKATR